LLTSPLPAADESGNKEEERPATVLERARDLGLSGDDNRPNQQFETRLFGARLIAGGEISTVIRGRYNYELLGVQRDEDARAFAEVKLETVLLPTETTAVFVSGHGFGERRIVSNTNRVAGETGVTLDSLWLLKTDLFDTPWGIQIGRQRLRDRREFWWDENIDAVRLHYFGNKVTTYFGIGYPVAHVSSIGRMDPEEKGQLRAFGSAAWDWAKNHQLEIFGLRQSDKTSRYALGDIVDRDASDTVDARLSWLGIRARGCDKPKVARRLCYWSDLAWFSGSALQYDFKGLNPLQRVVSKLDATRLHGRAIDVGASVEFNFAMRPTLTFAYAKGSGDRPGTPGENTAFQQTGLHKNDSRYRGLGRFRSYGEVLRPDLSNMRIKTMALGLPIGKSVWLETLWHRYHQAYADKLVVGSPIGNNPSGRDPRLGKEIDLALSVRSDSGRQFELTAGAFRGGAAFGQAARRWAGLLEVQFDYNF
jgi:alginate production protein